MNQNVEAIAKHVAGRIQGQLSRLRKDWENSSPVFHVVIDDLFPMDLANAFAKGFPDLSSMRFVDNFRERKYTSANSSQWSDPTRDAFLALQHPQVLKAISQITGINELQGDPSAYAGGISAMSTSCFLDPHLDNSTHPSISGYRRLNALYYCSEDWNESSGGNLELWSPRMKERLEVVSKFNRLVIMNTNRESLHSVNKVMKPNAVRKCISNYYFTLASPDGSQYSHVTSFRGRPEEPVKDIYLRAEAASKSLVQSIFRKTNKSK